MSALEQWLMDLLLEHNVLMLRAEAQHKAEVLALLILMQKDVVGVLASAPAMSEMGKAGKNALLRESNELIAEYYGRAQLVLDLGAVATVEALGVRSAISTMMGSRIAAMLTGTAEERAAATRKFASAISQQEKRMAAVAEKAGQEAGKAATKAVFAEGLRAGENVGAMDARAAEAAKFAERGAKSSALARSEANRIRVGAESAGQLGVRIGVGMPTENYLRTLVSDTLVMGSPAKAWWLRQQQDTAFKLATQIRIGAAQGETNAQIVARVVGNDEIPGVMPMARKNALSIVQTSMATVAAAARRATFEMNSDLMTGIEQVSTMDGHTSLMCIAYSGAQWDLDYEPMGENHLPYHGGVPRHHGCRSTEIAVMKTFREMGIDLDEPEEGTRASSSGPISAKTTFADYLTMKGADYQNEVLGKGRAELFREGKLAPRDLVNMSGRPLKLSALKEMYSQ